MGLLRLFFALSVLLGHINCEYLLSPIYAVNGFYIISGFYMSMILNEKYNSSSLNTLFYKKRFMRLLPTYWLLAILHLILALYFRHVGQSSILFFDFLNFPENASITTYLYIILSNIFIFGQDIALFLGISPENGDLFFTALSYAEQYPLPRYMLIPVAWSIGLEFCFYILAPFILRNKPKRVFILIIISIASNLITNYYGLNNSNWRFRFFPSTLIFFLTGYLAYIIYNKYSRHFYIKTINRIKIPITLGVLTILTLIMKLEVSFAIHIFFLLLINLLTIPFLFQLFKSSKFDKNIGELSYPLYLIHPLFIGLNEAFCIDNKAFIIIGSLFGAFICYQFYIKPLEKKRARLK